jgi:hypothetical protein
MTIKFYPLFVDTVFKRHIPKTSGQREIDGISLFPAKLSVNESSEFDSIVNIVEPKLNADFAKVWISRKRESHQSDLSIFTVTCGEKY